MKTSIFPILLLALLLPACKNSRYTPQTLEWTCGEGALTVTKTLTVGKPGDLTLTLGPSSLCQSDGIKVVVTANGKPVYEEIVSKFPFTQTWKLEPKASVSITTEVTDVESNIQCIRLGEVTCTAKY